MGSTFILAFLLNSFYIYIYSLELICWKISSLSTTTMKQNNSQWRIPKQAAATHHKPIENNLKLLFEIALFLFTLHSYDVYPRGDTFQFVLGSTYISTRSTLMPQASVASSNEAWQGTLLLQWHSIHYFTLPMDYNESINCPPHRRSSRRVMYMSPNCPNTYLHAARDGHTFAEDFVERPRAHRIPERGLG